jgi:hypothetical protein
VVHSVPITGFAEPLKAFISSEGSEGSEGSKGSKGPEGLEDSKDPETSSYSRNLKALKAEIEAFNSIEILGQPRWLKPPTEGQTMGSIVLALPSKTVRNRCILQGLRVANQRVRVVPYRDTSPKTLCGRCQQFGHAARGCKNSPKCRLCGKKHFTWTHRCNTYNYSDPKPCSHLEIQYINCKTSGHWANSKDYEIYKAL